MKALTPLRCAVILVLLTLVAYSNSFSGVFVFDDHDVIEQNDSIKSLATALSPPKADGMTTNGRPIVNLSLAVNYAIGGTNVTGYHVVNLLIHVCAGLVLFGVVRQTMEGRAPARPKSTDSALPIAFCISLLWLLHPLQTESVTYIAQRAESLVSLFYLLTLYCFIRGAPVLRPTATQGKKAGVWMCLSALACFFGMATKEVMVSAPLAVLIYDAIFVSGGVGAALSRRRGYYAGLFSAWILLTGLLLASGGRGGTAGINAGITPWQYALTQCEAVIRYIRLVFWPHPLVFDYGAYFKTSLSEVVPYALILVVLIVAAVIVFLRKPRVGYLAVLFFALLAPSSSVIPVTTQTSAEHRMYLALATILILVVIGLWKFAGRATIPICLAWALVLGAMTFMRNRVYADATTLWADTARKAPWNARAHANLGNEYLQAGRTAEAEVELKEAIRIGPPTLEPLYNLGMISQRNGQVKEAIDYYQQAIARPGRSAPSRSNLALMLDAAGQSTEALAQAEEGVRLEPDLVEARVNLGTILGRAGRVPDALVQFERAAALAPDDPIVLSNYATALFQVGRFEDSRAQLVKAVKSAPNDAGIHQSLGYILLQLNRRADAAAELRRALEIEPGLAMARSLLDQIK